MAKHVWFMDEENPKEIAVFEPDNQDCKYVVCAICKFYVCILHNKEGIEDDSCPGWKKGHIQ